MKKMLSFLKGFEKGFENFGKFIKDVVNYILLTIVYIIGVGFTAIIAKIFGKKFLNIKKQKKSTYWTDLNLKKEKIENYYRQF